MSFDRPQRPINQHGDFVMREALLVAEVDRELFVGGERSDGDGEIVPQIVGGRVEAGLVGGQVVFRELDVFALTAASVAPMIVRDAE